MSAQVTASHRRHRIPLPSLAASRVLQTMPKAHNANALLTVTPPKGPQCAQSYCSARNACTEPSTKMLLQAATPPMKTPRTVFRDLGNQDANGWPLQSAG